MDDKKRYLSMWHVTAIESVLSKGDRVELIPIKDGVKLIHISRKEIKPNTNSSA